MPGMIPPAPITGTLKYQWIQSTGTVRDLTRDTSPTIFVPAGSVGMGLSSVEITEDKLPAGQGSFIKHINIMPRTIQIPIVLSKPSFESLLLASEDLHEWFDTGDESAKRPGTLVVTRPDDTVRHIKGYYQGGLEGDLSEGSPTFYKYVIDLFCPDPAPTDAEDTVLTKTVAEAVDFNMINQGRLPAFPIWKLTGPFTNVDVLNATTGVGFSLLVTLTAGQYIIVDTRPSELRQNISVYDQAGANRFPTVYPTSVFFPLLSGTNNIQVNFTSGTTGATSVELTYLARYRSLLR